MTREIFEYLDVESSFVPSPEGRDYNVSGVPKSGIIYKVPSGTIDDKAIFEYRYCIFSFLEREKRELLTAF